MNLDEVDETWVAGSMLGGAEDASAEAVPDLQDLACTVDSSCQPADGCGDIQDDQSADEAPSRGALEAAEATAMSGHDSADDVCSTPATANNDSLAIGSQQVDTAADAVPKDSDQPSSIDASADTSTFGPTSAGGPRPQPAAAAEVQDAVSACQQDALLAPTGSSDSSSSNGNTPDAVHCATHVEGDTPTVQSNTSQPAPDTSNRLYSPFTALAVDGEDPFSQGAAEQEQQTPAIAGNSNTDHRLHSSTAATLQDSPAAVGCNTAGTGGDTFSAQPAEPLTTDTSHSSNGSHLSIAVPTPLLRGGSMMGQVKSPSRLRRMSFPAAQPDQQDQQSFLAQLDQQLQGSILACARSNSGDLASWQDEQQQQGHNEAVSVRSSPDVLQPDAHAVNLVDEQYCEQQQQQHFVQASAELGGSYAEPVLGSSSSNSSHFGEPDSLAHHMEASSAGTTIPSFQDSNSSRISSSSSYSAALSATQQLPWPLSWHWPDKMLHAAATGVRPISIRSSSSSGAGTSGSPLAAAGSGCSSGGSRSGGKISRPGSPGSPIRSSAAANSSGGADNRSSPGSRLGSPSRTAAAAAVGQQQSRPPEVLSAIHAHIASAPPVQQAFAAATAAAMQQQDGEHHSDAAADVWDHHDHAYYGNPVSVPNAVSVWHNSLQQQFAVSFAAWDVNGDGYLNHEELHQALQDVLPGGAVGKEEARYCQVLLDRLGSGLISPQDVLTAAHIAVTLGVGVVPKTRIDINDVLLQLAVKLKQQQQRNEARQGFAAQIRSLFAELDSCGSGRLSQSDLARLFRRTLPAINQQDIRYVLTHMCDVCTDRSQVSLKQLVAAVQPVQQALQQITNSLRHKELHQQQHHQQQQQQQLEQGLAMGSSDAPQQQQQQQGGSQWDLPKPPSPVRLSPRPAHNDSSSSSRNNHRTQSLGSPNNGGNAAAVDSSSSSSGIAAVLVSDNDQPVPPVLWPMQELAALLSSLPTTLQLAFMQTAAAAAAAAARSPKHGTQQQRYSVSGCSGSPTAMQQQLDNQQQQRHSLIPISSLPQLLAAAAPSWGGADISYAALQIRCHMNVVANFAIDTPTAAGSNTAHPPAADPPSDLMYAELAATIISAAGTEAAAAAGQLPAAVEQLVVDLTDELMSDESVRSKLAAAWQIAAAAAAARSRSASSGSSTDHDQDPRLPVVAAVKLLCKQLIGSQGLSDIRLLAWLTCLVRQQHLAMQLAAAHSGGSSSSSGGGSSRSENVMGSAVERASDQGLLAQHVILLAEISLDHFSEVLLQIVQGLLPADDAALIADFKHQQHQHHMNHSWDDAAAAAALPGQLEGEQTSMEKANRRARIQFDGSTPTPSDCSPAWCPAEQHQQKWDEGLRSLRCLDQRLISNAGYFQPSHVKIPAYRGSDRDMSTPGSHTGSHYTSFLLDDRGSSRFSNHSGRFSSTGGLSLPPDAQQQREQLDRLRAAQQQAWKAEMLLQHMPWEGAYSPVAAIAAAAAEGGYFGSAKVVDILRISSSGLRTLSNMSEGY